METLFWYKLALSMLIGGSWVTLTTIIAEKFGPRLGGLISGIPSTALFTYVFIALTQSKQEAIDATTTVPMTVGLYSYFFVAYLFLAKKGVIRALLPAIIVWCFGALFSAVIDIQSFQISILLWALSAVPAGVLIAKYIRTEDVQKTSLQYTWRVIMHRAVLSGLVIATGVLLAKIAGPVWGGIFSTFPALTISTLLITNKLGTQFSIRIMKHIFFSIIVNLVIFAAGIRYGYQWLTILWGTVFAFFLTIFSTMIMAKTTGSKR